MLGLTSRTGRARREPERVVAGVAAVLAVGLATAFVAMLLFGAGNGYSVTAQFQNAGQLVGGDRVEIGGHSVGTVTHIGIGDNGEADVHMRIDGDYLPLRSGTRAV